MNTLLTVSFWLMSWVIGTTVMAQAISSERITLNLNGRWQFGQMLNDFPPEKYTRSGTPTSVISLSLNSGDLIQLVSGMAVCKRYLKVGSDQTDYTFGRQRFF